MNFVGGEGVVLGSWFIAVAAFAAGLGDFSPWRNGGPSSVRYDPSGSQPPCDESSGSRGGRLGEVTAYSVPRWYSPGVGGRTPPPTRFDVLGGGIR